MSDFKIKVTRRGKPVTLDYFDVKALLLRRGESVTSFAKRLGCSREALSRLIGGEFDYPLVRERLVREIEKMWREDQSGLRKAS